MKTYTYTNHRTGATLVISAACIADADAEYEKVTGANLMKDTFIGVEITAYNPIKQMLDDQEL